MANKICTACGYEGKAIRPPSDAGGEDGPNETGKALNRVANLIFPGMGFLIRPMAMALVLPIYIVLWPIKRKLSGGPKHCPNCGLPTMVSLKSDAGWLAKRKEDIKLGLVKPGEISSGPAVAFGREMKLPGDEKPAPVQEKTPESLPALDVLLAEAENNSAPTPVPVNPEKPKKPVDPDAW